jgi:hypothetical protein
LIVAYNAVRDAAVLKWTSDGQAASSDITVSTAPARWAYDGECRYGTTRQSGSASVHYFNLQWSSSIAFDVVWIKLLGGIALTDLDVLIDDDGDFGSGATVIAAWSGSLSPTGRYVALELGGGNNRYTGTGHMQIRMTYGSSVAAGQIAEVVVGQRRQISRRPDQGTDYDDAPIGSVYTDLQFRGRDRQRFMEAYGHTDWHAGWTPNGTDQHGLDDVSTFRSIVTDSEGLRYPVLWIDQPTSAPEFATWGFLDFGGDGIRQPYTGWAIRGVQAVHEELPPFCRNDSRYDQD